MASPNGLRLRVWNAGEERAGDAPLRFPESEAAAVELRCLPGASGIHLVLCDGDGVRLRAEVPADPGETVPLCIELGDDEMPHVTSPGRSVLLLPTEARYQAAAPFRPAGEQAPIDLAFVIDGTLRSWGAPSAHLLEVPDLWTAHVDKLLAFAAHITEGRDWRAVGLAFGDQEPPAVSAPDLRPRYLLYPAEEERVLQPLDPDRLRERLLTLPSTPGGDFVDALADALAACSRLRWRTEARRLLVVSGDSPGLSLLHALPQGADLCARRLDVDSQIMHLHRLGVEVLTIYHAPAPHLQLDKLASQGSLLQAARQQYRRLASLAELAFEESAFQPVEAAERLKRIVSPVARGAALGEWVRVPAFGPAQVRL